MSLSQIDQLNRGSKLLKVVRENERELPGVAPFRTALEKSHEQAVRTRNRRAALAVAAKKATKQLNSDLAAVQDASIALGSFVKSVLGYRNVKLGQYGIKPIRKRSRSARKRPL